MNTLPATVVAVHKDAVHAFSKKTTKSITLLRGIGVQGDAHSGQKVKHRSRVQRDPDQPNLRQIHLIHAELLDELEEKGFRVEPGQLGENITTRNISLLDLPADTRLLFSSGAIIELTGLRNPCSQIDDFMPGLLNEVLDKDAEGNVIRKCGVMGVVIEGGTISPKDHISQELPAEPHRSMMPV